MDKKSYKEDGRPAMQFYVDDWLAEVGLNLCSLAAQGLWIRMCCYMWKAKNRGCLQANDKQISSKELAKLASKTEANIKRILKELEGRKVFSRLSDNTIICRRMYYKALAEKELKKKEEEIKKVKVEAGRLGGLVTTQKKEEAKEKQKQANRGSSTPTPTPSSTSTSNTLLVPENLELAVLLKNLILKNLPNRRIGDRDLRNWTNDVHLMKERDNRTLEEIKAMIIWTQADSFWRANILSMGKLRKQFDQLSLKQKKGGKLLDVSQWKEDKDAT